MQLWMSAVFIFIVASVPLAAVHGAEGPMRAVAEEIARLRARMKSFEAVRAGRLKEERSRARLAEQRRVFRAEEAAAVERARLEYVRGRPPRDTTAEDEKRDRLARQELEREERMNEARRKAFVRGRLELRRALRAGPRIDEMLEYDLKTERVNRVSRDGT